MSLFRLLKYITNVTESEGVQIMKIALIIYNSEIVKNLIKHWISVLLNCQVILKPYSIKVAILKTFCINPW